MATLRWEDTDGTPRRLAIEKDDFVLGRDPRVDCVLDFRGVSRRHALMARSGASFFLEDLGSTNGTRINGAPLSQRVELHPGDRIQLGKAEVEFGPDEDTRRALSTEPLSRMLRYERVISQGLDAARNPSLPEVLPRRFGKFELREKLGQGGMGAVYRAEELDTGREVALKLIRNQIGRREAFLEFFHNREAVLAREIDHPNVVQILEHGVHEEQHYIAMEYVRGENLYRRMKRRRPEPAEVLEILRQVACGLAAAHRQGVVHSDVKPGNIVVSDRFQTASDPVVVEEQDDEDDVDAPGILEFEGDHDTGAFRDLGLEEEIRRRAGERVPAELLDDPPYFPRPAETRYLEHYLDRTAETRGFLLLVEGESGVGKRRLVSEFFLEQRKKAELLLESEAPVFFELDCSRIEGIPRLYEQLSGRKPGPDFNLRQIVDELKTLTEELGHAAVIRVLEIEKASPLACYLLNNWVRLMDTRPILVIATLDSGAERENSSVETLMSLSRPVLKSLYLRPLTKYQIQRYLDRLFPGLTQDPHLASNLYRLSHGNVARLLDLVRSFLERGVLRKKESSGTLEYQPNAREIELEEGKNLYETYRSYGKVEQRVLQAAAFIGGRFFFDVLHRFLSLDETSLFFVVRQLLADGFLVEEGRTWYRFTNDAFRLYMAERLPPPERPHLHRKLTRLLETVSVPESPELLLLRGDHYAGCREHGKAVLSWLDGAHLARNEWRMDLAREMHQKVLGVYRELARSEGPRREVNAVLRSWFRRDGNWYELLGDRGLGPRRAHVKIADFGISFRTADEQRGYALGKRPILGTPRYIAPERGRGEHGGPPSDLFSLGVIAYELAVGRPPFPGLKKRRVVKAYQSKPIRLPDDAARRFPEGFRELVEGMLAIDPTRRWDAERVVREIVKLQFDLRGGGGAST